MRWEEFRSFDATALAELVRKKEVRPEELLEAAIRGIESWNPALNAVVIPLYDQARAAVQGPIPDGPFAGVPFLVKDLGASLGGTPMTMGSAFLKDFISVYDNELVKRFKRAGLIVLGKTSTPELGILPTTEPLLWGPCRNPWNPKRTAGGSSGGSAAAVSAGLVPMAHGNDGGGSIRIPASCCGIFGLKPTRARNPLGPDFGDLFGGMVVEHAVTRSVRDSAALLDAISGPDVGDPYWAPPPIRPFLKEVGADPGRLRIAFTTASVTDAAVHEDCIQAVQDCAALCGSLGHEVEEGFPSIMGESVRQHFMVLWSAGVAWVIDGLGSATGRKPDSSQFEPLTWALYEMGRKHSASAYLISVTALQRISREVSHFFLKYDLWLTPTLSKPPVPLGTFDSPLADPLAEDFVPFTPIANITGQPAMSVPLYWNRDGLPVGTHFVGRFGDEATLLRLAAQLEAARPWGKRHPRLEGPPDQNGRGKPCPP